MKVGQLWYSRALQGAGGINRFQILAGSGMLDDPRQPVSREIVRNCYRPAGEDATLTWLGQPGYRIVVRRIATGIDDSGRSGNYFAHALVGDAQAITDDSLGRLWDATGWQASIPRPLPEKLDVLDSIDSLQLGPALRIPDDVALTVVAGFLAHARRFRGSAIATSPAAAAACAALVSRVMPATHRPISFCSNGADEEVERYMIVAGSPPTSRFLALDPRQGPYDQDDARIGELVLLAHGGDHLAKDAIDGVAALGPNLVDFADGMRQWVRIDRRKGTAGGATPIEVVEILRRSPSLSRVLALGEGGPVLAEAIADGMPGTGDLVAVIEPTDAIETIRSLALDELSARSPEAAATALVVLGERAPATATSLARSMVRIWAGREVVAQISPQRQADLLAVVAAKSPGSSTALKVLVTPQSAGLAFVDRRLPISWRARALGAQPESVRPKAVAQVLIEEPIEAELAKHATDGVVRMVPDLLNHLDATRGLEVAHAFAGTVSPDTVDRWMEIPLSRAPAPARVGLIDALAGDRPWISATWGDLLRSGLDQLAAGRVESTNPHVFPARVGLSALRKVDRPSTEAIRWCNFCEAVDALRTAAAPREFAGRAEKAAEASRLLLPWSAATAWGAMDLVYTDVHLNAPTTDSWFDAMVAIDEGHDLNDLPQAWTVLCNSVIRRENFAVDESIRARTVFRLAYLIGNKRLSSDVLDQSPALKLHRQLTATDRRQLTAWRDGAKGGAAKVLKRFAAPVG